MKKKDYFHSFVLYGFGTSILAMLVICRIWERDDLGIDPSGLSVLIGMPLGALGAFCEWRRDIRRAK